MSRTEGWALGGAAAAHVLLFAALSFSLTRADPPPLPASMAVEIVAEAAPVATAPQISSEEPAPVLGVPDEPPVPVPPEPEVLPPPPRPVPPPPPTPKVEPDRARERQQQESEARQRRERQERTERERVERERLTRLRAERERQARVERERREREARARADRERREREARNAGGGDPLGDIANQVRNTQGRNPNPPAQQTAAQVRQSIQVAVDREIAPFWQRNVPTGVDVEQLRVTLEIRLNRDGSLASVRQVGELSGRTESNAPQQALFVERAIRSVRQAGSFALPPEHYDQWAVVRQTFRATR